jgi:hypothetical protein
MYLQASADIHMYPRGEGNIASGQSGDGLGDILGFSPPPHRHASGFYEVVIAIRGRLGHPGSDNAWPDLEDGYFRSRKPGGEELRHHRQTSLGDAVIAPVFAYDLCIGGADSDNAAL